MEEVRKRRQLKREEKLQIYKEATVARAQGNGLVAEVLRRWGIHSSDLTRVTKTVEEGVMAQFKMNRSRRPRAPQAKPDVKADRPNQVWSWDLTYIALGPFFVYFFAIIDVFSRKIVGWHLSLQATVKAMKVAWDKALTNEGLLGRWEVPSFPLALLAHGIQMAKKTAKEFFRDLGIKQLFARYQTPEDNSWIESWFRILKYDWLRFQDYVSFSQLEKLIENFIYIYNCLRYHGAVGCVTPEQKHSGEAEVILLAVSKRKRLARLRRLEINRNSMNQIQWRLAA